MDDLSRAERQLHAAEELLLNPTPDCIRETKILLEQAALLVARVSKERADNGIVSDEQRLRLDQYARLCLRVHRLLEGALKVQWVRMHWIASITQTYTRGAKIKSWNPARGTLNLEM